MSRQIEIICDCCQRTTQENENLSKWGGFGSANKSYNIELGIDNIDLCPECIRLLADFMKSLINRKV